MTGDDGPPPQDEFNTMYVTDICVGALPTRVISM